MFLVVGATECVLETSRLPSANREMGHRNTTRVHRIPTANQATGFKTTGWEESVGGASEHLTIQEKNPFAEDQEKTHSHPAKIQHSQEHLPLKVVVCVDLVSALTRLRPPLRYSRHVDRRWCGEVQPLHPGQVLLKHRQAFLQTLLVKRDENLVMKLQLLFRLHHIQTSSGTHHVVHSFFWLVHRKVHAGFEEASGESFLKLGDTKVTNI